MKIDGLQPNIIQPQPQKQKADPVKTQEIQQKQIQEQAAAAQQKKAERLVDANKAEKKPIQLSKSASKEIMKNYAEYYFKQGKQMESVKNYRQAISAYERSNIVEPDINKGKSVHAARSKLYGA